MEPLITFNCNKNSDAREVAIKPTCHSHLFIESKALFAVLTGVSHWNNYERWLRVSSEKSARDLRGRDAEQSEFFSVI